MTVYLDTCSIQRPFDDQSQLRVAMESEAVLRAIQLVEQGDLDLLASETLRIETEQNPHSRRRRFAFGVLALATRVVETDSQIESRARQYEDIGLRPFDALHLSSAVEAGADMFCTTDDQLLRRGSEAETERTRVLTPVSLIEEIES
jgi:predicted nucleic acid-binding protein